MIARKVAYNSEVLVLILADPSTAQAEVEEAGETEIDAKLSGGEFRRPNRATVVADRISYDAVPVVEDWQQWRGIQAFVGTRRVICPIWPDVLPASNWAKRVHASELVVGWDQGGVNCKVGTVTNLPDRDYLAPVIIGRLTLNDDQPLTAVMAKVPVEVTRDERVVVVAGATDDEAEDAVADTGAAALEITAHTIAASGYWEDAVTLSVAATSEPTEADYAWTLGGVTVAGETRPKLAIASLSTGTAGSYLCTVSNGLLTKSVTIPVTLVEHSFSYEGEGNGGMGTEIRYDQRVDYIRDYDWQYWMYLGIGDSSDEYKDGVLAWAKDCAVGQYVPAWESSDGTEVDTASTWYLGCYGAQNCTLRYTNVVGGLGTIYMSFGDHYDATNNYVATRRSKNNHLILEGCTLENNGGGWNIPSAIWAGDETGLGQNGGNSVVLSSGTTLRMRNAISFSNWDSTNWQLSDGTIMRSPVPLGDTFEITGSGTVLTMEYATSVMNVSGASINFWYHATDAGATFSLNNYALIRGGRHGYPNSDGVMTYNQTVCIQANTCSSYNSSTETWTDRTPTAADVAFRFGGGYLALYGDCRPGSSDYYQWAFDGAENHQDVFPLACLQVRNADGTWRAAVEQDFTLTYCATDAEGLAATGGRYDGLAGYTIITAGSSI